MMEHADLYDKDPWPDEKVTSKPLDFDDLVDHDWDNYYQDIDNNYRESGAGVRVVYCRGTTDTEKTHAFLQYYHFEPSSSLPDTLTFWHEGDWEMFQIAVKLDTSQEEMTPIAVTAAQHYYGQTIRWNEEGNGPGSQDQDYVGKSVHRPKVYVARETHATYFRDGDFRCSWEPGTTDNHGDQYDEAPTIPYLDDETGTVAHSYSLLVFQNSMISHWRGLWGADLIIYGDGPPGPAYKSTAVNAWDAPKAFNNYYRKLDHYPDGDPEQADTNIP